MADEATEEVDDTTATTTEAEGAKPDEALGEGGKKALEAERAARVAAEKERTALAAKLKEIEDKDKTEAEKAAERLADAEKRAVEVEARANRAEVSATSGIPVEILAGPKSTTPEDITAFAGLVATFAVESAKKNPSGLVIPNQGKEPEGGATDNADDWLRALARA